MGRPLRRVPLKSHLVRAIAASLALHLVAGCGSRCNPSGVVVQNGDVFVSAQDGIVAFDRTLRAHRVIVGRADLGMDTSDEAFTVDREGAVFVPLGSAPAIAVFRKEAGRTRRTILGRIPVRDEVLRHIAVDGKGDVYYPALDTNAIDVSRFAAGGRPVRVRRIGGISTEPGDTQFGVSRDGTVCLTVTPAEIGCLRRGSTNAARPFAHRALGIGGIMGIAFDPRGTLGIATSNPASVAFFRISVDGQVRPLGTIAGPRTRLRRPEGIAFGPHGEALVVDSGTRGVVGLRAGPGATSSRNGQSPAPEPC
jgi:hypothetical protein